MSAVKPDKRFIEGGRYGHTFFIDRPCIVCGKVMLHSDLRVIWEIQTNEFRGDDLVYGAHKHCESGMAAAVLVKEQSK